MQINMYIYTSICLYKYVCIYVYMCIYTYMYLYTYLYRFPLAPGSPGDPQRIHLGSWISAKVLVFNGIDSVCCDLV